MNPKLKYGLIIGALIVAGLGSLAYLKKQFNLIKDSCYTISGGIIHTLGLTNIKMTIFFKIVNESDITIKLSDMIFNIYVNNIFVTKISKPEEQVIFSKNEAIIQLEVQFNPVDLLKAGIKNIQSIIYDKEKLIINIKGTFSAKTGGVKLRNFPIDEKITLKELTTPSNTNKKC